MKAIAKEVPLWKNPYVLAISGGVLVFLAVFIYHIFFRNDGVIDPTKVTAGNSKRGGVFGFLRDSLHWKKKPYDIFNEEQLAEMGIPSGSTRVFNAAKKTDFRNQRRIFALRKYEAIKRLGDERKAEKEEFYRRMDRPEARQLKDAILSLNLADNLGIMKLENLLEEKLMKDGGRHQDIDLMIFAYKNLGQVYQKKNMQIKAKDAYLKVFQLLKAKAPAEQGPNWDQAIGEVEKINAKAPRN